MQVILKQNVKGTGKAGDVVKVSDGYARNLLIPKKMAVEANSKNLTQLKKNKELFLAKVAGEKKDAENLAEKLKDAEVVISAKAGEEGKLFGSITNIEIAKELEKQHGIKIDKKKIIMNAPIKQIGNHELDVKIYTDVLGKIKVKVIEQ